MSTRCALLLLSPLLVAARVQGQQEITTAPARTGRIALDVVVTPKSGTPVAGLEQPQFTVLDNKVARPLTSFRAVSGAEVPTEVVLLIDTVNVPYQTVAYERQQIDSFLRANGGQLAHPTTLAIFTDTGTRIEGGFSTDGNALSASLKDESIGLRDIRRSAGFYGATDRLQLSLTALRQLAAREAARPGRKIIVWVSPGWPLLSGPGIDLDRKQQEAIFADVVSISTQLRQGRVTIYSVDPIGASESVIRSSYYEQFVKGVSKPGQVDIGDLGLQVLATQTGGLVMTSNNDVAGELKRVMEDTSAFYELSFEPQPGDHPNEYHPIQVNVSQPGLTARTRTGYYAQP